MTIGSHYKLAVLLSSALLSSSAFAQNTSPPIETTEVPPSTSGNAVPATGACQAEAITARDSKLSELYAICGRTAMPLGASLSFVSAYNASLGRLLVVNRTDAGEQVYMVREPTAELPMLIEDLTNSLAASALGLKVVQVRALSEGVDISGFATSGVVRLNGAAPDLPLARGKSPVAVQIAGERSAARVVNPAQKAATAAPAADTTTPTAASGN
jgi:hypothetical protein